MRGAPNPLAAMLAPPKALLEKTAELIKSVPPLILGLREFVVSLGLLLASVMFIIVLYILFRKVHPRLFLVSRSSDFETYVDMFKQEMEAHMTSIHDKYMYGVAPLFNLSGADAERLKRDCRGGEEEGEEARGGGGGCVLYEEFEAMEAALKRLMSSRETLQLDLHTYYQYFSTLRDLDAPVASVFAKRDALNERRFNDGGLLNRKAVEEFQKGFSEPYENFLGAVASVSRKVTDWERLSEQPWYNDAIFEFLTRVHQVRLMTSPEYTEQMVRSYDMRKGEPMVLQFNIFTLYWVPVVRDIFVVNIPNHWKRFPATFLGVYNGFLGLWGKLGPAIMKLPAVALKRREDEGEPEYFTQQRARSASKEKEEEEEEEGDLVENFGFLKGLVSVGEVFAALPEMVLMIVDLFMNIASDPIGTVMRIILFIILFLVCIVLYVVYLLVTALMLHVVVAFVIAFSWAWWSSLMWTLYELVFVLVMSVLYFLAWIVDIPTGGLVVKLMRCESLPNEWETRANYASGNKTERSLMCNYPCASRFRPTPGGWMCGRIAEHLPSHCPQQQILATFRTGKPFEDRGGHFMFERFHPRSPDFHAKTQFQKLSAISRAFTDFGFFMGDCYKALRGYDYINRHLCANIERMPDHEVSAESKAKLRALCRQCYCDYEGKRLSPVDWQTTWFGWGAKDVRKNTVRKRAAEERAADCLCRKIDRQDEKFGRLEPGARKETDVSRHLFTRSLWLLVGLCVVVAVVYTMVYVGSRELRAGVASGGGGEIAMSASDAATAGPPPAGPPPAGHSPAANAGPPPAGPSPAATAGPSAGPPAGPSAGPSPAANATSST